MSSTNRACNPRHANDYYCTNPDDITAFLRAFEKDEPNVFAPGVLVLDPAAGGDPENPMSYPKALAGMFSNLTVCTIDIREDSLADVKGDYLKMKLFEPPHQLERQPDVVITNPPFHCAQQFVDKALLDVRPMGWVIMLQRLNFLGSAKRLNWWKDQMPTYIYTNADRMGFITKYADRIGKEEYEAEWIDMHPAEYPPPPYKSQFGKKDSIEYAHYVWQRGGTSQRRFAGLRVI